MDYKPWLAKGVMTGLVASAATAYVFNDSSTVEALGMQWSAPVAAGLGVGMGSLVADKLAEVLAETWNLPTNFRSTERILIDVGLCGAVSSAILIGVMDVPASSLLSTFALGAGSKLGGDYLEHYVFDAKEGLIPMF